MALVDLKVCVLGQQNTGKTCLIARFMTDDFDSATSNTVGAAYAAKKVTTASGQTVTIGIWDTAGAERFESVSRLYYNGASAAIFCFDAASLASFHKLKAWAKELQGSQAGCALYIAQTRADLLDVADDRTLTPESSDASAVSVESRSPAKESPNVSPTALERLSPSGLEQRLKIPGLAALQSDAGLMLPKARVSYHQEVHYCEVPEAEIQALAASVGARVFVTSARSGQGVRELFAAIAQDLAPRAAAKASGGGTRGMTVRTMLGLGNEKESPVNSHGLQTGRRGGCCS